MTSGNTTTCSVLLVFGAHVARTIDWETQGGGAGLIPGSPYHVALEVLDGAAIGQRDNQMQSNTVVADGTLIIVKDAAPDAAQDFAFTVIGNNLNHVFSLDDDADPTLSNTHSLPLPPGTYSTSEADTSGWIQTSATCSDGSLIGSISLASGETVTCTFTNTENAPTAVSMSSFSANAQTGLKPTVLHFFGAGLASLAAAIAATRLYHR